MSEYTNPKNYFVEVNLDNGEKLRWEYLAKEQADYIYDFEKQKSKSNVCSKGEM